MLPAKRTQKPPARNAFSRALDRFRERRAPKDIGPEIEKLTGFKVEQPAPLEGFHLLIRCAVTGRYVRLDYRRAPSGRYAAQRPAVKIEARAARSAVAGPPAIVSFDDIDEPPGAPCPWCGTRHKYIRVYCQKCRELVCTGRSYVDAQGQFIFVCREECGSHGKVQTLASYEVERMQSLSGQAEPSLQASSKRPALTTSKTPLLLPGKRS